MITSAYRDPRIVVLIIILIISSGIAGFTTRPKLEDPKSSVRWGYITTHLPGSSPTEVESLITEPIENALREAKAIRSIESSSRRGISIIVVRLTDEVIDVSTSWAKIQDKLSEIADDLPELASVPTLVDERRWDSYTLVVALVEKSPTEMQPAALARWGKEFNNVLRFVQGTRFTELFGLPEEEVRVEVSEESLAGTGLTIEDIAQRINQRDSNVPDAVSRNEKHGVPVHLSDDVDDLGRIRKVVLQEGNASNQLHLNDIAEIRRTEKTPVTTISRVDGRRAVVIGARMNVDFHIDVWTENQLNTIERFRRNLPAELEMRILFSQKQYTDKRSFRLYGSLGLGMVLVIVVVCLMMGWRAAIPICSALPLTLLGVFFLMIPFDISLHQMSIAGLILALGMLIDNPIIIVDDIQRRIDAGKKASEALLLSIQHLRLPLIGSNATTILGFSPILLIPGPTGEFLGQLGWAVIACLSVSLILSLTIIPVLAAWCLTINQTTTQHARVKADGRSTRLLNRVFQRPLVVIGISITLPVLGFIAAGDLREQFFPAAERDHFHFTLRMPATSSIRDTERVALKARETILKHDSVESVSLFVGSNAPMIHYSMLTDDQNNPQFAQGIVQLKSERVNQSLIRSIQNDLDQTLTEAQSIVTLIEQGAPTTAPIEFRIYGSSLEELDELATEAKGLLLATPGIIHVRSSLDPGGPQLEIQVKQHESETSGLTDELLARQVRHLIDGITLTTMSEETEEIPIRVRLHNADASHLERVFSLPIMSMTRDVVPLESIATWSIDQRLFNIPRRNSSRCNTVYGYTAAGELPIVAENHFKQALQQADFLLPAGYQTEFGGVSEERNSAVGNLLSYSAIILVLMASVLVVTFGSFRQAGIIASVGLLACGLGFLSLWLFNFPLGMVSIIGLMGMMGMAINDSIVVLVDCKYGNTEGVRLAQSVSQSMRHVFTTSLTTVAGVLPLILAGGDFWPPMMIVIAGGVIGATLLALGFTPAVYRLLSKR